MIFVPCRDHCYIRYGKQYTKECNTTCDYAKVCLKNKDMLNALLKHRICPECKEKMRFYLEGNFGGTLGVFECSCGYKNKSVDNADYYATSKDWHRFHEETKDIMW